MISRRAVLASMLSGSAGGAVVNGESMQAGQTADPRVLSGSDLGFRIDAVGRDGAPIGTIVVRVDGKWVAPQFQPAMRRAT